MHLFEKALSVPAEDLEIQFRAQVKVPWADFLLNPRRLRGSDIIKIRHQRLPSNGPAREALREKGQFWTPDRVAEAMVGYVIGGGANTVFDPAVGAGAFF